MASYDEIYSILTDNVSGAQTLRQRIQVACGIAAATIISGADTIPPWTQGTGLHELRVKWATRFISAPVETARQVFILAVSYYNEVALAAILGADPALELQPAVNLIINAIALMVE